MHSRLSLCAICAVVACSVVGCGDDDGGARVDVDARSGSGDVHVVPGGPRSDAVIAVSPEDVYVLGGRTPTEDDRFLGRGTGESWKWSTATDEWSQLPELPVPASGFPSDAMWTGEGVLVRVIDCDDDECAGSNVQLYYLAEGGNSWTRVPRPQELIDVTILVGEVGDRQVVTDGRHHAALLDVTTMSWDHLPTLPRGSGVQLCPVTEGLLAVTFEDVTRAQMSQSNAPLDNGQTRELPQVEVLDRRTVSFLSIDRDGTPIDAWSLHATYDPGRPAPNVLTTICTSDGVAVVPPSTPPPDEAGATSEAIPSTGFILGGTGWTTIAPPPSTTGIEPSTIRFDGGGAVIAKSNVMFVASGGFEWSFAGEMPPAFIGDVDGYGGVIFFTTEQSDTIQLSSLSVR